MHLRGGAHRPALPGILPENTAPEQFQIEQGDNRKVPVLRGVARRCRDLHRRRLALRLVRVNHKEKAPCSRPTICHRPGSEHGQNAAGAPAVHALNQECMGLPPDPVYFARKSIPASRELLAGKKGRPAAGGGPEEAGIARNGFGMALVGLRFGPMASRASIAARRRRRLTNVGTRRGGHGITAARNHLKCRAGDTAVDKAPALPPQRIFRSRRHGLPGLSSKRL